MQFRPLKISGAWEILLTEFPDDRGTFMEMFRSDKLTAATGVNFQLAQANLSISRAGVIRGIHYTESVPGQDKYVTCPSGAIWDVVVDFRENSPTFGQWEAVELTEDKRNAVYVSAGLGHGFLALQDNSAVMYLCSDIYRPKEELGCHPFDPGLAIDWPTLGIDGTVLNYELSEKDSAAPNLMAASQ